MLVTNQPDMVKAARIAYKDYPTAVNAIGQSNKTYRNEWSEYAKMDSAANKAQMGIGLSSNLAQLCLTYYWTKIANGEYDEELEELYHNCIILACLAQLLIDGIKRSFEVDALTEIERIQSLPCMQKDEEVMINGKIKKVKKDFPLFMKYIKGIPRVKKNGNEVPYSEVKKTKDKLKSRIDTSYICPMNWLEECLDKIQGAPIKKSIPTEEFYIRADKDKDGLPDDAQMGKISKIIADFDRWVRSNSKFYNENMEETVDKLISKTKEVQEEIAGFKISKSTMNRLIGAALGVDKEIIDDEKYKQASKYTRKILNQMYKYDKEKFLSNFVKGKEE